MAEKKSREQEYEEMTVEELTQRFREAFFYTDEIDEMVYRELEQLQAALDKKQQKEQPQSADAFWARFSKEHAQELKQRTSGETRVKDAAKPQRYRTVLRTALIAAVVVVLLAGVVLAAGPQLWAWVPRWNEETSRFEIIRQEAAPKATILTALEELGIRKLVYPSKLPDQFVLTGSQFSAEPFILFEQYSDGERQLTITITPTADFQTAIYQEETDTIREYQTGSEVHYLFDQSSVITALWYAEGYTVTISGNIRMNEMKRIIDSVYAG